jgi:hypothetical protein
MGEPVLLTSPEGPEGIDLETLFHPIGHCLAVIIAAVVYCIPTINRRSGPTRRSIRVGPAGGMHLVLDVNAKSRRSLLSAIFRKSANW